MLVDEQIRGGVVQGIGAAFYEQCSYNDDAQLENGTLADYLVPMAGEMPDIRISTSRHRHAIQNWVQKAVGRRAPRQRPRLH